MNLAKTNLDGPRTTFLNNGLFSIAHTTTDARFFRETGQLLLKPRFVNLEEGTLERLATSVGYTEIAVGTENDGVVRIDAGALYLGALFNVPLTDSGDYIAAAGTRLQLSGPRTILGSIDAPLATIDLGGAWGPLTVAGSYSVDTTVVNYGRLEFDVEPVLMRHIRIENRSTLNFNVDEVTLEDVLIDNEYAELGGRADFTIPPGGLIHCVEGAIRTDFLDPGR